MNFIKLSHIQTAVRLICSFAIALMSTIVFIQVVNRNVFGGSFKWVEEMSGMCMVWITFLGAALAVTYNAHTRIELFVNMMPKHLSRTIFALGDLACSIYSVILACYSWPLVMANIHTMSPAMKISLSFNYIVFLVAAVLIAIFFVLRAKEDYFGANEAQASDKKEKA